MMKFVQSVFPLLKQTKIAAEQTVFKALGENDACIVGCEKLRYYIDELHYNILVNSE
jgi:hypothetical protein